GRCWPQDRRRPGDRRWRIRTGARMTLGYVGSKRWQDRRAIASLRYALILWRPHMPHLDQITNQDLHAALRDMEAGRDALLAVVTPLTAQDLGHARRGGWTIERVLQHVIESEQTYAKLLAHQCGKTSEDL